MTVQIIIGDCREVLRQFPDNHFHCCVNSPPYWGMRDYGIEPTVWGGEADCEHVWGKKLVTKTSDSYNKGFNEWWGNSPGRRKQEASSYGQIEQGQFCQRCGAWLGCLGLEPTPELYVAHLVEVFREVRRVLREDSTLWLNLGDSYAGSWGNYGAREGKQRNRVVERYHRRAYEEWDALPPTANVPGLKPKDLVGIPWTVALALRDDGWWLRSAIPWVKANPMPESVGDRPTDAHEYIFLLAKSRQYYYDKVAVLEPVKETSIARAERWARFFAREGFGAGGKQKRALENGQGANHAYAGLANGRSAGRALAGRNRRTTDWWNESLDLLVEQHRQYLAHLEYIREEGGLLLTSGGDPLGLMVNPEGFEGDHYAVFPTKLVEPCVKAGTSERACPECGVPWERVIEKEFVPQGDVSTEKGVRGHGETKKQPFDSWDGFPRGSVHTRTIGFRPACSCYDDLYRQFPRARSDRKRYQQDAVDRWWPRVRQRPGKDDWPTVPCRVLDPFGGAGTTGLVADRLGRDAVLIDIKPEYGKMSRERIVQDAGPLFAQVKLLRR